MASIDLTRLDQQITQLASLYQDPDMFQEEFHKFSFITAILIKKDAVPKSFMQHYDLPEKILLHLEARLKPLTGPFC